MRTAQVFHYSLYYANPIKEGTVHLDPIRK